MQRVNLYEDRDTQVGKRSWPESQKGRQQCDNKPVLKLHQKPPLALNFTDSKTFLLCLTSLGWLFCHLLKAVGISYLWPQFSCVTNSLIAQGLQLTEFMSLDQSAGQTRPGSSGLRWATAHTGHLDGASWPYLKVTKVWVTAGILPLESFCSLEPVFEKWLIILQQG